jgi:hypothetical protein
MKGRIVRWFDNRWIICPEGGIACDVYCNESDLPKGTTGLHLEFDLAPSVGMFKAVNVKEIGD